MPAGIILAISPSLSFSQEQSVCRVYVCILLFAPFFLRAVHTRFSVMFTHSRRVGLAEKRKGRTLVYIAL